MPRPSCGINIPGGGPSDAAIVTGVGSTVFTLGSAAGTVGGIINAGVSQAGAYPMAAAIVAAIVIVATIIYFTADRCDQRPDGVKPVCMAGVIERVIPAFTSSWTDDVFAFSSLHDRVDVVVKQKYWDFIELRSNYVFCSDADKSPIIPSFYYNPAVCGAGIGSSAGAFAGAIVGLLIAAAAVAAIGCATWILCIIALIVAVLIVVAAAILGAIAGGQIGKAAPPAAARSTPTLRNQPSLLAGAYVTEHGTMSLESELNNALCFKFVTSVDTHGSSTAPPVNPQFPNSHSHWDPDQHLVPDGCEEPPDIPPIG